MPTESSRPQDQPSYVNAATTRQSAALQVVRDLAGGTARLRQCRGTYLPMEPGEHIKAYDVRLARSLLFNTFVKVREGLIGMALKKNPDLNPPDEDPVPTTIQNHWEDIDLAGNHGDIFIKELFRDVIGEGHAHILVDMQPPLPFGATRADEIASGRRPYWVKYKKDEAINWKSDRIDGETVLTQITLRECATKPDGQYGEKEITRYRVLTLPLIAGATPGRGAIYGPMQWEVFEEQEVDGKKVEIRVAGDTTDLKRIPVVTVYSRRLGFMESEPPLLDLAYLNIGHWQQWSDLNAIQRALVPILHIKGEVMGGNLTDGPITTDGAQQAQKITPGPGTTVITDKDGDVKYVGADPSATDAMREALIDLEQRMSAVGLSVISPKPEQASAAPTATEKVLDQGERMSELASWLRNLKDGIEACFKIHARYLGLPDGGSIVLGFDEPTEADKESLQAIDAPKGGLPGQMPNNQMMGGIQNGGMQ